MTEELVELCARAMCKFEGLDPDEVVPTGLLEPAYRNRWEMREFGGRAQAIIPIVRADALEEVSRHLSAVQYDPAPYTAMKYRLASLAKG